MRKLLFVTAFLITAMCAVPAGAFMMPDIEYTGNEVIKAHDTPLLANTWEALGLGGSVGNQFIEYKAFEFTVNNAFKTDSLVVDATLTPYAAIYETARSEHIARRLEEGATPEQIGFEINGDENTSPVFVGPSQNMGVDFALIDGSVPLTSESPPWLHVKPSAELLASASYVFSTEDSLDDQLFASLFIPLNAKLKPNTNYWIAASTRFSGLTLAYSTHFIRSEGSAEKLVNPEPATFVLFGAGLLGTFARRRKRS